jgi:hypothetical protein
MATLTFQLDNYHHGAWMPTIHEFGDTTIGARRAEPAANRDGACSPAPNVPPGPYRVHPKAGCAEYRAAFFMTLTTARSD